MSDYMQWFYAHYIKAYIEAQPKDDGQTMWSSLLDNDLYPDQKRALDCLCTFHAVHGFRLGLKMGLALSRELE